jgi:hypothetical protein
MLVVSTQALAEARLAELRNALDSVEREAAEVLRELEHTRGLFEKLRSLCEAKRTTGSFVGTYA